MLQVDVTRLHEDNREALSLAWVAGRDGATAVRRDAAAGGALIGHLNFNHPNSIQVLGAWEASAFADASGRGAFVERLLATGPVALVLADGIEPAAELLAGAARTHTPVLTSPQPAARVIEKLARYLSKALAESTERHGVCMDVLGLGVLITGDSGVGKSELGLELISRGHGLVADDVVDISLIAANTLEARSPALLKDYLEVRGLGVLNIRTIFGETAVRPKMRLRLVAHLERPAALRAVGRNPRHDAAQGDHPGRRGPQPRSAARSSSAQLHPPAARHRFHCGVHRAPAQGHGRPGDDSRSTSGTRSALSIQGGHS
jgi:HPr kinase/phosphorylase